VQSLVLASLVIFLLWLPRRRYRPTHVHPTIGILRFLLCRLQDLKRRPISKSLKITGENGPGRSTVVSHPRSSSHQRYRTPHNSWGQKTTSPSVAWQRTRIRPRRPNANVRSFPKNDVKKTWQVCIPDALCRSSPCHVFGGTGRQRQGRR
jgi:hypothetical protein